MQIEEATDRLLKYAGMAHFSETRIYNLIHEVGAGRTSADNALHLLMEDYKNLHELAESLWDTAEEVGK